MLLAAHNGGKAINISRTTAPHALSYMITSEFDVPHGHAVALTLGKFFEINEIQAKKQGKKELISLMQELYRLLGVSSASEAEKKWYKLMKECGLEFSLTKLGISEKQHIDLIVDSVNLQRLANHPLTLETFDLRQTLKISKASN
jgi:alcohol dehydrogenase class IV